ncbi:MAG: serine/threonine protein kinase [Gemmatimonadaceae bacterium]|nr:serine/threonine protein kinase [Gemmatimonadaceae bacterium]
MPGSPAPSELETRLSGRYRVERLLGRGGMGAVYLARDLQLDRLVAIKELPEEFANDPALRERFLREVKVAASFSHPNIVPVYAVEEHGQSLAFVMGFVEGESLAERVRRAGPLSVRETVRLLLDVAYALAYAHGRGVVHRDIKPDNIMIERATGRALLMDFGVARSIGAAPASQPGMTRVGEVVGTPEYMSPEQATGEELDGRSDLYSLGLVAHFGVTGTVAFGGESAARVLVRQLTEALPPMVSVRGDLPPALATAIDRCLTKERTQRYASAAALIEALDAAQAAAPEIPLAIRLFANDLNMLLLVLLFATLFGLTSLGVLSRAQRNLTPLLPSLAMMAVLAGRVLQSRSEIRRIRADGFTSQEIHRGLVAVLAEREARRQQLRANAIVVRQRRYTARMAIVLLLGAVGMFVGGLATRYVVDGRDITPPLGIVLIFSGIISFGFGMVLFVRNPLKAPADERFFRRIWLGPVGRRILGISGAVAISNPARRVAAPAPMAPGVTADARITALEARVTRLERDIQAP